MKNFHGIYLFCVFLTHIFTVRWSTVHIKQWAYRLLNGNTLTVCMMSSLEINKYPCKPPILGFRSHFIFADKTPTAKTAKIRWPQETNKLVYSIGRRVDWQLSLLCLLTCEWSGEIFHISESEIGKIITQRIPVHNSWARFYEVSGNLLSKQ